MKTNFEILNGAASGVPEVTLGELTLAVEEIQNEIRDNPDFMFTDEDFKSLNPHTRRLMLGAFTTFLFKQYLS